jgi:membrane fusion protein (multidrug efflux system)
MTKRMLTMLVGVLLLTAALAFGFYRHVQTLIASAPKLAPQTVTTMQAALQDWQPQLNAVGTLTPLRGVDVTPEISGLVRSLHFKSGQDVKAGAVLVQLNADSELAQLQSLQAAADLAAAVLERDKAQWEAQAISQAQLDSDLADLRSKRALVAQQQATIAKKTIVAPFAGKLGITAVNPGQYLNPGDKIVTLQTIDPIYADFYVPQRQLAGLAIGQAVTVTSDGTATAGFSGRLTAINAKVDATTRNVLLEATLSNPKRQLLPGMFANVAVQVGEKQRYLTLPQTAITYNPYGATVFIVKRADQVAAAASAPQASAAVPPPTGPAGDPARLIVQQVFVTAGPTRGDQVAVLKGVEAGQQVVTSGQVKLKNGTWVVVDNSTVPTNSANPTPQEK